MGERDERGIALIFEIIIGIAVLLVIGFVVGKALKSKVPNNPLTKAVDKLTGDTSSLDPWGSPCVVAEKGRKELTVSPLKVTDINTINPMGLMIGGHVTPIDHMYFFPVPTPGNRFSAEVRAMADGHITSIQHRGNMVDAPASAGGGVDEFRMTIEQTCNQGYYYDLITKLAPDIKANVGTLKDGDSKGVDIAIKAGQLIGYVGNQSLDFGVYDTSVNLKFIVPEHYQAEPWKVHTADAFSYFESNMLKSLEPKMIRTVEPRSGKIDFDKDGYLSGTWFEKGTNGYGGVNNRPGGAYYTGHLSFAYDVYDPKMIEVSIGFLVSPNGGQGGQYAVVGNKPNPAEVNQATGLVKYELTQWDYTKPDGTGWDRNSVAKGLTAKPQSSGVGTLLVQLTGDRELKLEYFAGKKPAEVAGFTSAAKVYER